MQGVKTSRSNYFTVSFQASLDATRVEREKLIYPLSSLVAEFQSTYSIYLKFHSKGSVFLKKTKKYLLFWKLIFCHKLSPLDWIMVIWTIFSLPGALWGPGRPMWGLGGLMETNFTNFHMGLFLALRCCFLDLTSF